MENLQGMLFDLDDTLYPEYSYVQSGFQAVSQELEDQTGIEAKRLFNSLMKQFEAGVRDHHFDILLRAWDIEADVEHLVEVYRGHYPDIELYSDARPCLEELNNRCKLGMITDGQTKKQRQKINALGIADYFDPILISGTYGDEYWKPSPKMFLDATRSFDLPPERIAYVADNAKKDFIGPSKIGMHGIQILRDGLYSETEAPQSEWAPDMKIHSLDELTELI